MNHTKIIISQYYKQYLLRVLPIGKAGHQRVKIVTKLLND